jgi:hypothetical protein
VLANRLSIVDAVAFSIWTAIKLSSFGHPPYRSNLGFGHEEDQAAASPVPRSKLLLDPRQREDIFTR